MDIPDYGAALRSMHELAPTAVADALAGVAQAVGAVGIVAYLVDFDQSTLTPIPARGAQVDLPEPEAVVTSSAGRAFVDRTLVTERRDEGTRVWVPILEGPDCTGVLAMTIGADVDAATRTRCEELGMLAGCAIALAARSTDLYNLVRRRKAMSLPASLQWDMLPPLHLEIPEASSVGVLEPAYDVGGDSFDHAVNDLNLDLMIMDAMGHGLRASLSSGLAMGTYRHERREGQSLPVIHERLDRVVAAEFAETFVTGQIARLAVRTGRLSWVNAGHPAPLLVRAGRVERALACRPSLPWGLGGHVEEEAHEQLEVGDAVLWHTDGVTEGRSPAGEALGGERLVGLVERAARSQGPPGPILRQLIHEVLDYQGHRLRDDATMLWVTWNGPN